MHSGWSLDDYLAPSHPLQQAVRAHVARATGVDESQMKMGIDGCSAPNYAIPLSALARGYARLAPPQTSCRSPMIADDPHWNAIYDKKSTFN